MAQITYRGNLGAKSFPFISENFGRSIIVKGPDQNFNRQSYSNEDVDKDIGIPQIYYCHNVMPHPEGLQSVGYSTLLSSSLANFTFISALRDSGDNKVYLGITSTGDFYISNGGAWVFKANYPVAQVTQAFVSGVTYIYIQNYGCILYDFGLGTFTPVVLTALNITGTDAIIGICPSAGYLIAWSTTKVYHSSTLLATDFTPSLVTGAGFDQVEGAKGSITFCIPHLLGFIVYTSANAVAALFSGNTRFPYNFREIVASGGLSSLDLIAYDANTGNHYAYTTSGMQLLSTSQSQTVFPEVTDFVAGKLFEDFNETTNTFSTTVLSATLKKRFTVISDRYMVISYGLTSFTHAIVYDLIQKRWGKLKIPHVAAFEYQIPSTGITEIPRQSFAFLQADGSIKVVDFSVSASGPAGVLVLGRYQYVRSRLMQLDAIELENIRDGTNFSLTDLYTIDGKTLIQASPYLTASSGFLRRYTSRIVGMTHSLLFKGSFQLSSILLTFNIHGKR